MCSIYIKNTFINGFEAENLGVAKGHHSYPPSPRDRGAFVLQLAPLDLAENLSSHHSHDSALVEVSDVQSSGDEIQGSFEKPASLKKKKEAEQIVHAKENVCATSGLWSECFTGLMKILRHSTSATWCYHLVSLPILRSLFFFWERVQSYQQQALAGEAHRASKVHEDSW